ncbi:MAG: hypothetical protein Fues2KO_19520 [Fuerstiella sp.]
MKSKPRNEKIKLALIPVLLLVLLAVLPGSDDESDASDATPVVAAPAAAPVPSPASASNSAPSATSVAASSAAADPVLWPRVPLNGVLQHDPFVFSDPRALLDRAFFAAGMTAPVTMDEVTSEEFFPQEADVLSPNAEPSDPTLLADLVNFFTPPDEELPAAAAEPNDGASAEEKSSEESTAIAALEDALLREEAIRNEQQQAAARERLQHQEQIQKQLTALQTQPVTMFMQSPAGNSVLLGDRRISAGEIVSDGIRVRSIERSGVTFEIIDPVASAQEPSLQ